MKSLKSQSSQIIKKTGSTDSGKEVLCLSGSQKNLTQRDKVRRKSTSRPASACPGSRPRGTLLWRRPASVDLSEHIHRNECSYHHGSTHSLCNADNSIFPCRCTRGASSSMVQPKSSLVQCQKAGFCGSDALNYEANTGKRCPHGVKHKKCIGSSFEVYQTKPDVELDPDVMRYAYTAESARLLQALLRESWHSDEDCQTAPSRPFPKSISADKDENESTLPFYRRPDDVSARTSCDQLERQPYVSFLERCIDTQVGREKIEDEQFEFRSQESSSNSQHNERHGGEGARSSQSEVCCFNETSLTKLSGRENTNANLSEKECKRAENDQSDLISDFSCAFRKTSDGSSQSISISLKNQGADLDSVPSKDSERTGSSLGLQDSESKTSSGVSSLKKTQRNETDADIDLKFQQWFPNYEKDGGKTVNFVENDKKVSEQVPPLIDFTELCHVDSEITDNKDTVENSTLNDLVTILQVLEEDNSSNLEYNSCMAPPNTARATEDAVQGNPVALDPITASIKDSDQERGALGPQAAEIFQYLDQAEHCSDVQATAKSNRSTLMPSYCDSLIPRMEDLLCRNSVDLAQEVLALRLQAEEQVGGIRLLQQTVAELKEANKAARMAHQAEIAQANNEAEAALLRHQKMVKQLLAEKKSLNEKMAGMMTDMKATEERHQRNLKAMEERHLVELQRVKETHAAAEKLKREKWIDVKTQKIKEMTVKGLEPELSRMAARQQQEMQELRNLHRSELEAMELRATRRTTELMDQLRAELARDKEEALQREAASLRTKWEKRLEDETRLHEEDARRLKEELRRERDRLNSLEAHVQEQLLETRRQAERERDRDRAAFQRECEDRLDEAQRQHQIELKSLKEALEIEKDVWTTNYKKIQANKFLEKEADLHHQYKRERDRDIEIAIERLETEATKARLELTEAAESRLKRLREKLEGEIREAEAECVSVKSKLTETRQQLAEKEDQVADLTAQIRHLHSEHTQLQKVCDEMTAERSDLRRVLKEEVDQQLAEALAATDNVQREMVELRTTHAAELAKREQLTLQLKADAEKELHQVYARVKATVRKKDEALEAAREQYKVALERCTHLEQMLENQRRNLLLK